MRKIAKAAPRGHSSRTPDQIWPYGVPAAIDFQKCDWDNDVGTQTGPGRRRDRSGQRAAQGDRVTLRPP